MTTRFLVPGVLAAVLALIPVWTPVLATRPPEGSPECEVVGTVRMTNGDHVPDAEVQILELGRSVRTGADGIFRLTAVPSGRFTLSVRARSIPGATLTIDVPTGTSVELVLDTSLHFQEDVGVTATPWASRPLETAQQVDLVDGEGSRRENVASVGEALANLPGVTFIPTGNALGTPIIRGISGHRIRVMNDGIGLNHQQNSWRHSPNVEPAFAEKLEVVRGPSSVLYGPDAMGGVINLVSAPLPVAARGAHTLHGELAPGFSSNTSEWTGRGRLEGALGAFGFRLDALRREGDDIETPRMTLQNTDFSQTNAAVTVGYGGTWGTARVRWNHWEDETGFFRPVGFRLDLQDDLLATDLHLPTGSGVVELLVGRQQNRRRAFPGGAGSTPGVDLDLVSLTGRLGFEHRPWGRLRGKVAAEYTGVDNTPLAGQLVPQYESDGLALMAFEELRLAPSDGAELDRVILSMGLRWDTQDLEIAPFAAWKLGSTVTRRYSAVTGALGAVVRLGRDIALAGSLGRGWRPPNPFELFARGEHGGVAAFQLGNPDLLEESNTNAELAFRYEGRRLRGSVSAYRNEFSNYIYLADSGSELNALPVFVHRQGDARIEGLEGSVEAAPLDWIHVGLGYALLDTRNEVTSHRLPQTAPDRLLARLRFERKRLGPLGRGFLQIGGSFVARGVVCGPDEPLGTPTDAYQKYDVKGGLVLPAGGRELSLDLTVHNLLNAEYTDFLWSYKPFAPNPGRDIRAVVRLGF